MQALNYDQVPNTFQKNAHTHTHTYAIACVYEVLAYIDTCAYVYTHVYIHVYMYTVLTDIAASTQR